MEGKQKVCNTKCSNASQDGRCVSEQTPPQTLAQVTDIIARRAQKSKSPPPPQTLTHIAQRTGIALQDLVKLNPQIGGATAPIQFGTRIKLPLLAAVSGQRQTLVDLAERYKIPIEELKQANYLLPETEIIDPQEKIYFVVQPPTDAPDADGVPIRVDPRSVHDDDQ